MINKRTFKTTWAPEPVPTPCTSSCRVCAAVVAAGAPSARWVSGGEAEYRRRLEARSATH
jgi:hypothetical protein